MRDRFIGGLIAALLLAGCEGAVTPAPADDPKPPVAPLYTEIGATDLLERWSVLPNGAVAEVRPYPGPGRLAATDGFSGLPHFTFRDAREYGACVVFTAEYGVIGSPGDPGPEGPDGPPGAPGGARLVAVEPEINTLQLHIIDCVGAAAPGNKRGDMIFTQ